MTPLGTQRRATEAVADDLKAAGSSGGLISGVVDRGDRSPYGTLDALEESERKYAMLVQQCPTAIAVAKLPECLITEVNEAFLRVFDFERAEEVLGKTTLELGLVDPESRTRLREALRTRRAVRNFEVTLLTRTGEDRTVSLNASEVSVGGVQYLLVLFEDITQRKRAEAALLRATQARDDMLGVVAHDLRNPLWSILLQAAILREPSGDPMSRCQECAEKIEGHAQRMSRIIDDLLDVTQLEAGQLSLSRARLSPKQLLADVVEIQRANAGSRALALEISAQDGLPEVWADNDRLHQVFENLVGNAIKFTPLGSVTVGAKRALGEVVFSVADTGVGIAAAELPHIFERFWQGNKGSRNGAGLGLAIVKGIVEAHGGRLWAESVVGEGSTFYFTLPQVEEALLPGA